MLRSRVLQVVPPGFGIFPRSGRRGSRTTQGDHDPKAPVVSGRELRVSLLHGQIEEAKRTLAEAETEVTSAISGLEPVLFADNRMSTIAIDRSVQKMKATHALIADLERSVASELAVPPA